FRSLGKTANLAGGVVRPHRNGLAHGKPPQFAILNHAAIDSGIPRESVTQRLGISRLSPFNLRAGSHAAPAAYLRSSRAACPQTVDQLSRLTHLRQCGLLTS